MTTSIAEPARRTPVIAEADVVVLGGGPAGIAAATAAARAGATTLLVERYGFLGGMGTAAGVTNFCGLFANVHGDIRRVVHGVAEELLGRIASLEGLNEPHTIFGRTKAQAYDMAAYKCAADDMLLAAGAKLLFHALAAGAAMKSDSLIGALLVETKSGRGAIRGRMFIDASGDGDLAAWAGAPFEKGDADGHLLYPTLMFRVNNVDADKALPAINDIPHLMQEAQASGDFSFPRMGAIVRPMKNPAEWRANITQIRNAAGQAMDGTDAAQFSAGEIEGRRQIRDYMRFLNARVPGFANSYVLDIATQVGIRETRRVTGDYALSGEDVIACRDFADTIGVNGWPLERHVAGDVNWLWQAEGSRGFNQLPYRMIVPRRVDNLFVAGRCASMTQEGQSAARVSGACFVMGEAAGTAAAMALQSGGVPRALDVTTLQAALTRNGAWLGREAD
ncbi:MAG: FAD-dependent oxidoreductase [Betaproteobacteria bacterium]